MPTARRCHSVCAVGDAVYVIGGLVDRDDDDDDDDDDEVSVASVLKYNVTSDTWTEVRSMPTGRFGLCVCIVGTHIYCMGGFNVENGVRLNVVERYDTESGDWSTMAPMPTARSDAAAFVLDGKIYVSGGMVSQGDTDVVERYDPGSGSWVTVASLPATRSFLGGCAVRSEVNYFDSLLSGGRD